MKYRKKLSSKLLLALGVFILGIIVWQVIVSKRVIGDEVKIQEVQSIEQMQELLTTGKLKTYRAVPCSPFSKIKISGIAVYILKDNEYKVYVSNYCKRRIAAHYARRRVRKNVQIERAFARRTTHNHDRAER